MSGFVVEVFSSVSGYGSSACLTELDGIACVVSDRGGAKAFRTFEEAEEAALRYTFIHQGHIASWAVRPI